MLQEHGTARKSRDNATTAILSMKFAGNELADETTIVIER